jgi:xanthosine utilization system XapX-like protein
MAPGEILNKSMFRLMRDAAATIKAISFFASPIVTGVTLLAYLVSMQIQSDAELLVISLAALAIAAGMLAGIAYYIFRVCDPAPYQIVSIEGLLVVGQVAGHDHHHYTNRREQVIQARRNNVRLVEHRSHWTGNGSKTRYRIHSTVPEHQLFAASRPEEDGRTPRWIYPGRALGKGDQVRVGLEEVFEDNVSPMIPYYREGSGRYKAQSLKVAVRFSIDDDPGAVDGLIWNNDRRGRQNHVVGHIRAQRIPNPSTRTVDYLTEVVKPKRYHSYGVRWTWPAAPKTYASAGASSVLDPSGSHPRTKPPRGHNGHATPSGGLPGGSVEV